jgi:hypothetical protein
MNDVWGPLGNPSKEEIQKWWDLPYGKFTELVKGIGKKKKNTKTNAKCQSRNSP